MHMSRRIAMIQSAGLSTVSLLQGWIATRLDTHILTNHAMMMQSEFLTCALCTHDARSNFVFVSIAVRKFVPFSTPVCVCVCVNISVSIARRAIAIALRRAKACKQCAIQVCRSARKHLNTERGALWLWCAK